MRRGERGSMKKVMNLKSLLFCAMLVLTLAVNTVSVQADALDYLGKGLDATVFQSAAGQGSAGAEMAYLAAKGEKVPAVKWVPFELVTPDKKEEYQARYKK